MEKLESSLADLASCMREMQETMKQIKSTGTEEESGGTSEGAAHIEKGSIERTPPAAANSGLRGTAASAGAAGRGNLGRRTSDPSPDTDVTRTLGNSGPGRVPFVRSRRTAGEQIAAATLLPHFRSIKGAPQLREGASFQEFKRKFMLNANVHNLADYFICETVSDIPVGDPTRTRSTLEREGYNAEEIDGAYAAWELLDSALTMKMDQAILSRCKTPSEALEALEDHHDPESESTTDDIYNEFHNFKIPPNGNPHHRLLRLGGH